MIIRINKTYIESDSLFLPTWRTNFLFQYIYYIPLHVSSTIMLIFRRTIVLTQHLVSWICSVHRLREDSRNLCTEQSPKDSDDTRCCINTTVLLKVSTILLETYKGKGKAVPLQARSGPEVKVPRFNDNGTGWWKGCQPYAPAAFTPNKSS